MKWKDFKKKIEDLDVKDETEIAGFSIAYEDKGFTLEENMSILESTLDSSIIIVIGL